jgi:DNA polymerase-3 subunit beta
MDLVIARKPLLSAIAIAKGAADTRSAMPALANVLLCADGADLRVAATNLYLSTSLTVPAEVKRAGSVAVPANDMLERVKAMPEGPIALSLGDGCHLTIKAVGAKRQYTLPGIPGTEFPAIEQVPDDAKLATITAGVLRNLIRRTAFAISTDETRAHVNSLLVEIDSAGVLRLVSTDGHRLNKAEGRPAHGAHQMRFLLPLRATSELKRLLKEEGQEDDITVNVSGPNVFFVIGKTVFSAKHVDAQFPPYEQVIPAIVGDGAKVPRAAFIDALKAVGLAANDKTSGVRVTFAPDLIKVSADGPEHGDGFDEVSVEYSGDLVVAGFNATYLTQALEAVDCDEVVLRVAGELDPLRIDVPGEPGVVFVTMPLRLGSEAAQ